MAEETRIEWCDSTFNPWIGCTKISPACDDCYAARSGPARTRHIAWGPGAPRVRTGAENWALPTRWNAQADRFLAEHGRRRRVFCASLADVFDNEVPEHWRWDLFRLIAATPHLDWLLLTKRIGNARKMLNEAAAAVAGEFVGAAEWDRHQWPNVWIGATVVNQVEADRDVPKLLQVPAAVRFLSIEPMLGTIDLTNVPVGGGHGHHEFDPIITGNALRRFDPDDPHLHWVICGGESGPKARPMHPDWPRGLRDQCQAAGVDFMFKQWGEWAPVETERTADGYSLCYADDGTDRQFTGRLRIQLAGNHEMAFVGKKAAGRLLDGRTHDGFPNTMVSGPPA